jgi:hypothetical protein
MPSKLLSLDERQKIIKGLLAERKAREQRQQRQQPHEAAQQHQQQWQHELPQVRPARPGSAASDKHQQVQQMLSDRQQAQRAGVTGEHPTGLNCLHSVLRLQACTDCWCRLSLPRLDMLRFRAVLAHLLPTRQQHSLTITLPERLSTLAARCAPAPEPRGV